MIYDRKRNYVRAFGHGWASRPNHVRAWMLHRLATLWDQGLRIYLPPLAGNMTQARVMGPGFIRLIVAGSALWAPIFVHGLEWVCKDSGLGGHTRAPGHG